MSRNGIPNAERELSDGLDVVDYTQNAETGEAETTEVEISCVRRDTSSSLEKPEFFGKAASSTMLDSDKESKYPNDWLADQNRYRKM